MKSKQEKKYLEKKNELNNKVRTRFLIIANEEFKTMKKSKMCINTMTPEELIKMYEQNYVIAFKTQESPVASKTSKKRCSVMGSVGINDKSISMIGGDDSVYGVHAPKKTVLDIHFGMGTIPIEAALFATNTSHLEYTYQLFPL